MTATVVIWIIAALLALSIGLLFVLPWALRRAERRRPWSPFGEDGYIRDDLMAVKLVDGEWVPNSLPNEGFYPIGTISEDGIELQHDPQPQPWRAADGRIRTRSPR